MRIGNRSMSLPSGDGLPIMHSMIFVNLPVADVNRSRQFFTDLGYTVNEDYSGDTALTLTLGDNQYAMLLQRDVFDSLHTAQTADAWQTKECVVCLGVETRADVDALVDRALAAGGKTGDAEDDGTMYGRSFHDLDGH